MAKLYPSKTKILTLHVDSDVKITKAVVRGGKIVSTLRQSKKIIAREVEKNKCIRESEFRRLSKGEFKFMRKEAKLDRKNYAGYITMSNETIASKVNCKSKTTGRKYKNILTKMGIIDYQRRFEVIHTKDIEKYYDGHMGFLNGARCYHNLLFREVTCQFRIGKDQFENFNEFGVSYNFEQIKVLALNSIKDKASLARINSGQQIDASVDLGNVPF